jgi:hypothetical protein
MHSTLLYSTALPCGLGWQKKGGGEKLVSLTGVEEIVINEGELTSYDIMLLMMDVTPL